MMSVTVVKQVMGATARRWREEMRRDLPPQHLGTSWLWHWLSVIKNASRLHYPSNLFSLSVKFTGAKCARIYVILINNGNRTEWSPVGSVITRWVINKIGQLRSGSPICLIMSMITDRIGRHEVRLPINHIYNKIRERKRRKRTGEGIENSF